MTRYRLLYLGAVFGCLGLCVASGKALLLVPVLFLLGAELLSAVFLLLASRNISLHFKAQERCRAGKPLPVEVKMTTESRLPLGRVRIKLRYHNTLFDSTNVQELLLQPARSSTGYYMMHYTPADCGHLKIAVQEAVCYDLLGILTKKITKAPDMEVVAYPALHDFAIRRSSLPHSAESSDKFDLYSRGQDVTEVFDMRDYQPGDSLHSIHWKLSGKLDHLVVREFSDPTRYRTMLFYDSSFYGATPTAADHAVMNAVLSMAASLSKNLMEENLPHCVVSFPYKTLDRSAVDSRSSFEVMLSKLMHGRVADAGAAQLDYFTEMELFRDFSKVIVITGELDSEVLRRVSEKISITAIELIAAGNRGAEQQGNIEIIRIPLQELEETVHAIEI